MNERIDLPLTKQELRILVTCMESDFVMFCKKDDSNFSKLYRKLNSELKKTEHIKDE